MYKQKLPLWNPCCSLNFLDMFFPQSIQDNVFLSENQFLLEKLVARVVSPYLGQRGVYEGSPDPIIKVKLKPIPISIPELITPGQQGQFIQKFLISFICHLVCLFSARLFSFMWHFPAMLFFPFTCIHYKCSPIWFEHLLFLLNPTCTDSCVYTLHLIPCR